MATRERSAVTKKDDLMKNNNQKKQNLAFPKQHYAKHSSSVRTQKPNFSHSKLLLKFSQCNAAATRKLNVSLAESAAEASSK